MQVKVSLCSNNSSFFLKIRQQSVPVGSKVFLSLRFAPFLLAFHIDLFFQPGFNRDNKAYTLLHHLNPLKSSFKIVFFFKL